MLIDKDPNSLTTVREFSDKVASVSRLTGEGAREIFVTL